MLKTILIIEDDLDIRSVLQEFFEGENFSVLLAGNGQEALEILNRPRPPQLCLILLDVMMPIMNGPTFLSELKRTHPKVLEQTPVYLMTARADAEKLTTNTTGILKKPLDLSALIELAKMYCEPEIPRAGV